MTSRQVSIASLVNALISVLQPVNTLFYQPNTESALLYLSYDILTVYASTSQIIPFRLNLPLAPQKIAMCGRRAITTPAIAHLYKVRNRHMNTQSSTTADANAPRKLCMHPYPSSYKFLRAIETECYTHDKASMFPSMRS
jgi:hypothetical protein